MRRKGRAGKEEGGKRETKSRKKFQIVSVLESKNKRIKNKILTLHCQNRFEILFMSVWLTVDYEIPICKLRSQPSLF